MNLADANWRKSSRSQSEGECVEVADNLAGAVALRDSKHPTGPALVFTPDEWRAFIAGTKTGEFNRT